jgi:hypothetical protein
LQLFVKARKATVAGTAMNTYSPAAVYLGSRRPRSCSGHVWAAKRNLAKHRQFADQTEHLSLGKRKTTLREVLLIGRQGGPATSRVAAGPPGAIKCRPTARAREGDHERRGSSLGIPPAGIWSQRPLNEVRTGNRSWE